jgi:hypothetical protein
MTTELSFVVRADPEGAVRVRLVAQTRHKGSEQCPSRRAVSGRANLYAHCPHVVTDLGSHGDFWTLLSLTETVLYRMSHMDFGEFTFYALRCIERREGRHPPFSAETPYWLADAYESGNQQNADDE